MNIRFKRLHPKAKIPLRGSKYAAGYDLTCTSMRRAGDIIVCGTGLAVEIPRGYFGALYARSSVYLTGWEKVGGVCVVDCDYRGEVHVLFRDLRRAYEETLGIRRFLRETGQNDRASLVKPYEIGDRIAQLIIQPCVDALLVESDELSETQRGTGGYGSTGR
ncbi:MAG: hypothetical protein PHN64_04005 [Desulfovibrionaceae bacterium]|nr:hypothetical protein [Desulfovibrionaceae bacterium]